MHLLKIHVRKKPMFHWFFFIFKFDENPYTLKNTTGSSLPNYIGPKRENPQACLTDPVYSPFPWRWRGLESP